MSIKTLAGLVVGMVFLGLSTAAPAGGSDTDDGCTDNKLGLADGTYDCNLLLVKESVYVGAYLNKDLCKADDNYHGCCKSCRILAALLQTTPVPSTSNPSSTDKSVPNTGDSVDDTKDIVPKQATETRAGVEVDVRVWVNKDQLSRQKADLEILVNKRRLLQ